MNRAAMPPARRPSPLILAVGGVIAIALLLYCYPSTFLPSRHARPGLEKPPLDQPNMATQFQDSIVLFGDSITSQQYVCQSMHARFCEAYRRSLDVLNRGYGGYNTRWAKQLVDVIFAKKGQAASTVRLVTIWFGANDAVVPEAPVGQHVPLDEYETNLRYMLDAVTSPTSPYAVAHEKGLNVVLITPPPIFPAMMNQSSPFATERRPEVTKQYGEVVKKLADEYKAKETTDGNWRVGLVDMWTAMTTRVGEADGLRQYLSDGLHLTAAGYGVFWDEYTKLVKHEFRGRGLDWTLPRDLPLRVPAWDDIDPRDPGDITTMLRLPPIRQP